MSTGISLNVGNLSSLGIISALEQAAVDEAVADAVEMRL
jgi:hypothetical protein